MDPIALIALLTLPFLLTKKKRGSAQTSSPANFPRGKGLFVNDLNKFSREEFLSDMKSLNIKWVVINTHFQQDTEFDVKTTEFLSKDGIIDSEKIGWLLDLNSKGVSIWFSAAPSAYAIDDFIKLSKKFESLKFAKGYIFMFGPSFLNVPNSVEVFYSSVKKKDGLIKPIGVSTISSNVYRFSGFDFGLPIFYEEDHPVETPSKTFEQWKNVFDIIIPIWFKNKYVPLDKIISETPSAPAYAWSYDAIKTNPQLFEVVKNFKWDKLKNGS